RVFPESSQPIERIETAPLVDDLERQIERVLPDVLLIGEEDGRFGSPDLVPRLRSKMRESGMDLRAVARVGSAIAFEIHTDNRTAGARTAE
ncbi:MAG TPA: hypothetical protein VHB97_00005, partial [Polyangia bacterium]|nr:hypothetical protein [Polyangia bacterium]